MADEKKPEAEKLYKQFIAGVNSLQEISRLAEAEKDPRPEVYQKAQAALTKYAIANAPKDKDPSKITEEERGAYISLGQQKTLEEVAVMFSEKADKIAKQLPEKGLEALLFGNEEFAKSVNANPKYAPVVEAYQNYKGLEDLAKRAAAGAKLGEQEQEMVRAAAGEGAGEAEAKRLKERGYSERIQELGRKLAISAAHSGTLKADAAKKYISAGLGKRVKGAKEMYEKVSAKLGSVYDIVRKTIATMAKGDSKTFENAWNLAYHAAKAA